MSPMSRKFKVGTNFDKKFEEIFLEKAIAVRFYKLEYITLNFPDLKMRLIKNKSETADCGPTDSFQR